MRLPERETVRVVAVAIIRELKLWLVTVKGAGKSFWRAGMEPEQTSTLVEVLP